MVNKSGIYKITNVINNKFYIGSSVNIRTRWNEHKNDLKKSFHGNIYLQRSHDKYGMEFLTFEILEECEPKNCIKREQYFIDTLNPEYNLCRIAGSSFRNPKILKPVSLFNLNGELVKNFIGVIECAEYLNCDSSTISACAKGIKTVTVKNHFVLFTNSIDKNSVNLRLRKIKTSKVNKTNQSKIMSKSVEQIDLQGNIVKVFDSIHSAAVTIKVSESTISKACKQNIVYKNYNWRFKLNVIC
jgi:hypothetical protein